MGETRKKLTPIQKIVGANMLKSVSSFAQPSGYGEFNMEEMVALKNELKAQGKRVSWTALFCKVLGIVLKEFPSHNARLDGDEVIYYDDVNIGVGVDTPRGLVIAVVKKTQEKTLFEIADDLNDKVDRARDGKLTLDDMSGSTVTISNLVGTGSIAFTSIVNNNEAVIFGFGEIRKEPVVDENGNIVARYIERIITNTNHTLVNGMDSVRMGQKLREVVENPRKYLL